MKLLAEKRAQACEVAAELGIDLWMICERESIMQADPAMGMVIGREVTWQSFFLFSSSGDSIALVGNLDEANFLDDGYTEVVTFTKGVGEDLLAILKSLNPSCIAINFSEDDPAADGLSVGMYRLLCGYLKGTVYADRLVSAEHLVSKLRSRKLPAEIERLSKATELSCEIWDEVVAAVKPGMSERKVAALIDAGIARRGLVNSFPTAVNAGDKSEPGHGDPTKAVLGRGDLLHVDFGLRYEGYCSDIQRLAYMTRPNESGPSAELCEAFDCVRDIITATANECQAGTKGFEIDALAREMLAENGYPEYQHALGHQLGRSVHDGGGLIGPKWERYGRTPEVSLEENNVFTLELEIMLPGIGCVGLEEDMRVTDKGARFFGTRQMELLTI